MCIYNVVIVVFVYIINYKEVHSGCSGYGGDAIASYNYNFLLFLYYFLFIPLYIRNATTIAARPSNTYPISWLYFTACR